MEATTRIVVAALALLFGSAAAAQAPATDRLPASLSEPSAQSVEQKRQMVERILKDSPVATRIQASGNDEARRYVATAQDLSTQAQQLLAGGRTIAADALLNEAMWQIGRARQLVPDREAAAIDERVRNQQLQQSVASLEASYRLNVERLQARGAREATADRDRDAALALVADARALTAAEKYGEANRVLDRALGLLLADFQRQLGGQVLIYSRSFPRPDDEYQFELERNRSYESLVPLAITEFNPGREARGQIERFLAENRGYRDRAERQAANRNLRAAAQTLQEGTDALQRALQAAGLTVPQTIGQQ